MPTYEYACRGCGEHVEVVQSFRDTPLETCGLCGGALRKVFSAAGIIFKGSGYYVTDSRASSGSTASTSASTPGTSDPKSADTAEKGASSKAKAEKPAASSKPSSANEAKSA